MAVSESCKASRCCLAYGVTAAEMLVPGSLNIMGAGTCRYRVKGCVNVETGM